MGFVLPSKSEVGFIDPEIAGEGQKVVMSDGDVVTWSPPPAKPVMPDWSEIKQIKKYFNRTGHQVWPAWLYHPKEEPRLVKTANDAAEIGVCYREATQDERGRYGLKHVWDWKDDSLWRPQPYDGTLKFNPAKPGLGKNYIAAPANPIVAQDALVERLLPAVASAVINAMKNDRPNNVDPGEWAQFLQFQAWQKTQAVIGGALADDEGGALSADAERSAWEKEAERKGVRVDRRWSLERLKVEVEKTAA